MSKELSQKIFDAALELLQWAEGDTELARGLWGDAFEEAERIDHNQSLEDAADEPDELVRAYAEQARRFDEAEAKRQKFHVVKED
jgi:hypothetical protein